MRSPLDLLRQTPQPTPARFVGCNPGCWIQYYDDTGAKNPTKALSARSFDVEVARRKQREGCAVCFSLQAFGEARTREELLCFRNLGVDVDLVSPPERRTLSPAAIDRRKDDYLERCLLPFPLRPHWLVESRHGFHVVFRIQPLREESAVHDGLAVNRRLVTALHGDPNAVLLTQVLRVPGTYQFKEPQHPFLCRLLMNNAAAIVPYELGTVRSVLDAGEAFHLTSPAAGNGENQRQATTPAKASWEEGLKGVPEGRRNSTATVIVGAILARLPESLWETAGYGGLREWNRRNLIPLPEQELRSVFTSIVRRERTTRGGRRRGARREDQGDRGMPPRRRDSTSAPPGSASPPCPRPSC